MGVFDFLSSGKISGLLKNYPVSMLPHRGDFAKMKPAEMAENLAWFEGHKADRVVSATRVLAAYDLAPPSTKEDAPAFSQRLDRFFKTELVKYSGFGKSLNATWEQQFFASPAPDPGISFLEDVALLLGELVVTHAPIFRWDVDRDPWRKRAKAETVGRIVLFADGNKDRESPSVAIDIDRWVVSGMWETRRMRNNPMLQRANIFLFLPQILEGRYDPV